MTEILLTCCTDIISSIMTNLLSPLSISATPYVAVTLMCLWAHALKLSWLVVGREYDGEELAGRNQQVTSEKTGGESKWIVAFSLGNVKKKYICAYIISCQFIRYTLDRTMAVQNHLLLKIILELKFDTLYWYCNGNYVTAVNTTTVN